MSHYDEQRVAEFFEREKDKKEYFDRVREVKEAFSEKLPEKNKYNRNCKGISIDVYDVLKAFNVTCPAMQHAIKKMLCTGIRGYKGFQQDADEAINSIKRSKELNK